MQPPVKNGGGQDLVAEDGAPLGDDLIGRDEQATALVAPRDQLQEEMRAADLPGFFGPIITGEWRQLDGR